jgi:hypothetical protein
MKVVRPLSTRQRLILRAISSTVACLGLLNLVVADPPVAKDAPAEIARRHGLDPKLALASRVASTPASVLALFREAGRPAPRVHALTAAERLQLKRAIQSLPALHRRILGERLRVLSFLDGMPNTALTSSVNPKESFELFDITFNARILHENLSEWLTRKERTCFEAKGSPLRVDVEAGTTVDALVYVLLHEATHIVDMAEQITPQLQRSDRIPTVRTATAFTQGVWNDLSIPIAAFRDPVREQIRFYGESGAIAMDRAPDVYAYLRRTPFASLYGGRNWLDDLAEYVSVYHLTEVLKQPYRIVVRRGNDEVFAYEPMKSELVRRRIGQMKRYYAGG